MMDVRRFISGEGGLGGYVFTPAKAQKYSEDQPRDDHGRWTSGGGFDLASQTEIGAAYRDATQRLYGDAPKDPYAPLTIANELEKGVDRGALKHAVGVDLGQRSGLGEYGASIKLAEWARTTGDHEQAALDMQAAAKEAFGLHGTTDPWEHTGLTGVASRDDEAFLRAMYGATQDDLRERGIDGLYVYRGTRFGDDPGGPGHVELQPLSSWTINAGTAIDFSTMEGIPNSRLDAMWIPADRIVATPRTGFGAAPEGEVVVMGGRYDTSTVTWKNASDSESTFGLGTEPQESDIINGLAASVKGKAVAARLDADLRNADWPKRTWDVFLPPRDVRPISSDLPAWQAAPPAYRHMLKYSPDQPRDEDGRWASGVGSEAELYESAHVETLAHAWSDGSTPHEFREALRQGSSTGLPVPFGLGGAPVYDEAKALLKAANSADPTPYDLYRGIAITREDYRQFGQEFHSGASVDLNLSSWSKSEGVARAFAANKYGTVQPDAIGFGDAPYHTVIFDVQPGAHAYDATYDISQGPQYTEHIMAGRFAVDSVDHVAAAGGTYDTVHMHQSGTLDADQLVKKVAQADGPARLLPWLEAYMEHRMVPPKEG